jgi:hypothetical protein
MPRFPGYEPPAGVRASRKGSGVLAWRWKTEAVSRVELPFPAGRRDAPRAFPQFKRGLLQVAALYTRRIHFTALV